MDTETSSQDETTEPQNTASEPVVEVDAMLPPPRGAQGDGEELPSFDAYEDDATDVRARKMAPVALPDEVEGGDFSLTKESVTAPRPEPAPDPAPMSTADASEEVAQEPAPAPLPDAPAAGVDMAPSADDPFLLDPWPDGERTQTLRRRLSRVDAFAEYRDHLSFLDSATPPPQVLDPQPTPKPDPEPRPDEAPEGPSPETAEVAEDPEDEEDLEDLGTQVWDYQESEKPSSHDPSDSDIVADRYRMNEELAVGGMARIYRVTHINLEREFAMKILSEEMSARPVIRKNFVREAKVASQMEHPNIVQVTDFGVDDTYGAFIVMEYLKGETLRHRLHRKGPMRMGLALDLGLQLAEALHYIHERNIIHCDIKAENIFLVDQPKEQRRRTVAKLLDFGLSKTRAMGAQLARSEVGGTPHYMSPEHFAGVAPQPSMDIYSLGVLLYEMVVGKPPFDGNLEALAIAHHKERPKPPSERLNEPVDERVDELLLKALEKKPEDRQTSMGQLVYELRTLMNMLGYKQKRVVPKSVERAPKPEQDEGTSVFENSPCPQFRVDQQLNIVVGNAAFCSFLGKSPAALVGKPLDETKLHHVYPTLRTDFLECLLAKTDLQHRITIKKAKKTNAQLLLWLVQEVDPSSDTITFSGIIVPQGV